MLNMSNEYNRILFAWMHSEQHWMERELREGNWPIHKSWSVDAMDTWDSDKIGSSHE